MSTAQEFYPATTANQPLIELAPVDITPSPSEKVFLYNTESLPIMLVERGYTTPNSDGTGRHKLSTFIEVDGHNHFARITEADEAHVADPEAIPTIFMLPGLTEMVDGGTAKDLHDDLALRFPESRVVSIATDGVGIHTAPLSFRDGLHRTFDEMADDRLTLMNALQGGGGITLVAISMGTAISVKLLERNSQLGNPLPIEAFIAHSHAIVPKGRVLQDMVGKFLPHIGKDVIEVAKHQPIKKLLGCLAVRRGFRQSMPAMASNIVHLLKGSEWSEFFHVASEYPTGIISGAKDPLRQEALCKQLAIAVPSTVLYIRQDIGHGACLDSNSAANDITETRTALLSPAA